MSEVHPLVILGVGGVGRALVRQILDHRDFHEQNFGVCLQLRALCDRQAVLLGPLEDETVGELLEGKEKGGSLADHPDSLRGADLVDVVRQAGQNAVVVDATASRETVPALLEAVDSARGAVLANKKPLTESQQQFDRLTGGEGGSPAPGRHGTVSRCRWETTVGAGLPVIATLIRLRACADPVRRISGAFSSTLGFLMSSLERGVLLSQAVQTARQQGYAEPDPREDLGGLDVARKLLILARTCGHRMELDDIELQGLCPEEWITGSLDRFWHMLPSLDGAYRQRVEETARAGRVLRYAARFEEGFCQVGPLAVDKDSPLGGLSGNNQLFEISSRWYRSNALVIQGRGEGVQATAAGLLSDIMDLIR